MISTLLYLLHCADVFRVALNAQTIALMYAAAIAFGRGPLQQ